MRTKHTPGPWKYAPHLCSDGYRVFVPHEADNDQHDAIADLETWQTPEETEANACLIAAAPDLLAACEKLADHMDFMPTDGILPDVLAKIQSDCEQARAAIQKAKTA